MRKGYKEWDRKYELCISDEFHARLERFAQYKKRPISKLIKEAMDKQMREFEAEQETLEKEKERGTTCSAT